MMFRKKLYLLFSLIFILLLASCQQNAEATSLPTGSSGASDAVLEGQDDISDVISDADGQVEEEITSTEETSAVVAVEPTQPSYTPTPDLRLPPEEWRNWPVVPEVSPNAVSIYLRGIELGNDPHAFTKIGDCQSIKEVLLGIYDQPMRYKLLPGDEALQEIIDNYTGSFNRDGMAVHGGFNAATVLSPIWADPELCEPGENPIQCEYRVHKPTMAIISLEVWWDGRSPERYEQYMRRIIEYSIEQGVVPILSTKADNVEGNHSINYTTAKLAYEYDIPLWNFWLAVQDLPNQGIDPARDGFHISVDAWNRRSYTALQTLAAVYNAAQNTTDLTETVESEVDAADETSTVSSLVFGDRELAFSDLTGTLYFEMTETINGKVLSAGIYTLDFENGSFSQVYPAGSHILDSDSSYGLLLSSRDSVVFVNHTGEVVTLSGLELSGKESVYLISDNQLLVTDVQDNGRVSLRIGSIAEGGTVSVAPVSLAAPLEDLSIVLDATSDYLVGVIGACGALACDYVIVRDYQSPSDYSLVELDEFEYPAMNENGTLAYWRQINGIDSLLLLDLANQGTEQYLGLFGNVFLDQAWQRDGNLLATIKMERSDYYGRATEILHYVVDPATNIVREYASLNGLNPLLLWSPDDTNLVTSVTEVGEAGDSTISIRTLDTETSATSDLAADLGLSSETFIAITELIWID